ncbi:hypothetical protein JCM11251_001477 [Rhodosporidiobolus azoricus]
MLMQQAHYFAPVRPPSPTFLRVDHSTYLSEYVQSLLPPPPSPYATRKRNRSASPTPSSPSTLQRAQTAPLPPVRRSSLTQPSSSAFAAPQPLSPPRRSTSPLPFPSLPPPRTPARPPLTPLVSILKRPSPSSHTASPPPTATDGASFVHDHLPSFSAGKPPGTPSSPSKPPFASLSRSPSSAFVAASQEGRVHPLTLHAVARRDSEFEALRLVRERKATERRRENSAGAGSEDGTQQPSSPTGGPPRLLRKQSWTAAGQAMARGLAGVPPPPRSESPVQLSDGEELSGGGGRKWTAGGQGSVGARRKKDFAGRGLGLVQEAEDDTPGSRREGSEDTVGPTPTSAASTTGTSQSASATTPQPGTPTLWPPNAMRGNGAAVRTVSSASLRPSIAPSVASTSTSGAGAGTTTKRRSLFSRFTRSGRSVSHSSASSTSNAVVPPLSPGIAPSVVSLSPRVSEFGAQVQEGLYHGSGSGNGTPIRPVERIDTRKSEKGKEREGVRVAKVRREAFGFFLLSLFYCVFSEIDEKDTCLACSPRAQVKTKGKSTKDFGRLFLAQELVISPVSSSATSNSPPSSGFRPSPDGSSPDTSIAADTAPQHSHPPTTDGGGGGAAGANAAKGKKQGAVWAMEWSDDGRYLAVGGKDGVVRVWEVLSTPSAREAALWPHQISRTNTTSPPQSAFSPADSPPLSTSAMDSPPLSRSSMSAPPLASAPTPKKGEKDKDKEKVPVSVMPVFSPRPVREFRGHDADVLDLSWSKNNFLLSSSMDKTVRLWHVSRSECLCAFQHLDFVTSIAFHPKDDRFFLSGSLDCKLRLWNIPEKRVHIWTELPELITSVSFSRDGQLAIAGTFVGICMFFEVSTFRYHSQFAAKSTRGKNAKGKKVTAMCPFPLPSSLGERLLVTTNDSRIRLYHTGEKLVETKYAGHENTSSQIRATFSDDGRYIISGSEDQNVYIWDSCLAEQPERGRGVFGLNKKHKDGSGYECFPMSAHIVTAALFAPTPTRQLLASAHDLVFADGHTHTAPLSLAKTTSSLATNTTDEGSLGERLVPARTREGPAGGVRWGGAEDAIIVVADDETGIISIYRNSTVPADPTLLGSPVGTRPISSAAAATGGAGDSGYAEAPGSGMSRSGSLKRWSKGVR